MRFGSLEAFSSPAARLMEVPSARALLEPRGLLDELGGRGLLGDERERAVLEDRELGRDDLARGPLGLLVGLPTELHDVHAVLTQRGTHGVCGGRLSVADLELDDG